MKSEYGGLEAVCSPKMSSKFCSAEGSSAGITGASRSAGETVAIDVVVLGAAMVFSVGF